MPKIITTLNDIRAHSPCHEGYTKLLKHLGKTKPDDKPLDLLTVLESNGFEDTLWCFKCAPHADRNYRKVAVRFARQVQHLMTDPRSLAALDVAERHADGLATDTELDAARAAAWAAARDAARDAAWAAARAAAWAAARDAAWAAARAAVWAAARDAAWAAARDAAWAAARDAARDAAWAAAWAAQVEILRAFLTEVD